jgi:hypothetical protein
VVRGLRRDVRLALVLGRWRRQILVPLGIVLAQGLPVY